MLTPEIRMFYRLVDQVPVRCASGQEWLDWFENAGEALIVGQDEIDSLFVLTVFTGIDQGGGSPPQLFETITAVDGIASGLAIRSATWNQAEREHRRIVSKARNNDMEGIKGC